MIAGMGKILLSSVGVCCFVPAVNTVAKPRGFRRVKHPQVKIRLSRLVLRLTHNKVNDNSRKYVILQIPMI